MLDVSSGLVLTNSPSDSFWLLRCMPERALLILSQSKELSYIASGHVRLVRTGSELLSQPGGIIAYAKMTGGWNASQEKKREK